MRRSSRRCGPHNRRQAIFGAASMALAAAAPRSAEARAVAEPPRAEDEKFMRLAIAEAAQADFPFGAVIAIGGEVAAKGRNLGKTTHDPTAHGEMIAIRNLVMIGRSAEFPKATIYTSGEPCPMCMGAIIWCGMKRVVFAASIDELSTRIGQIRLTSRAVAEATPFETVAITGGVLSQESLSLFR